MTEELRIGKKKTLIGIVLEPIEPEEALVSVEMVFDPDGCIIDSKITYSDKWAPGPDADRIIRAAAIKSFYKNQTSGPTTDL